MATTKRRTRAGSDEDKARRRDEILAAAKATFGRKGFHATTIADVARAADLSYGTVYWYFDSKDDLFAALIESEDEALRHAILDAVAADPSNEVESALRRAIAGTFAHFDSDPDAVRLMFRVRGSQDSTADAGSTRGGLYDRFVDDLEALVLEAQKSGMLVDAPPRVVAFSIGALIGQFSSRRLATDDGMSANELADFVVTLVLDGLRA
jgi:AcrR family transcriptional regulator